MRVARDSARQARITAEQANQAKDRFLAVLSHELRTPLTPVQMGVSMLQERPDLDPVVRETLDMTRQNVEMEARLIDDLLDLTRIARGKVEIKKQRVDLREVVRKAEQVCRPDIEARGLHFGVDLGGDAPYWIEADPVRIQQVIWNLLKNSTKFTPHGGCVGRNQGATFLIRLPLCEPAAGPEAAAPAPSQHPAGRPLRILLVEDHALTAKMMRWVLTEEGHQVETAGDIAGAVRRAGERTFDLLISDLGLPDGSGHDLMRELRQDGHEFPGIALSGYGQEEDIQRSYEAGFTVHLIKPTSRERLIETVAAVGTGELVAHH